LQYCPECKINISSKTDRCPLCRRELPPAVQDAAEEYPGFEPINKRNKRLARTATIVGALLIGLSVLCNLLWSSGGVWCAAFSACVLYVRGPVLLTFNKRIHLGWKLFAHAVAMPLLLIVANIFASRTEMISRATWAISYAMPAIFVGFIVTINIIMLNSQQKRQDYLLYQLSLCVIAFVPLILALCGLAQPVYPSIVAAACSILTIGWLLIFAKKIVSTEFVRKFHI
jgi:hypothetical protein